MYCPEYACGDFLSFNKSKTRGDGKSIRTICYCNRLANTTILLETDITPL